MKAQEKLAKKQAVAEAKVKKAQEKLAKKQAAAELKAKKAEEKLAKKQAAAELKAKKAEEKLAKKQEREAKKLAVAAAKAKKAEEKVREKAAKEAKKQEVRAAKRKKRELEKKLRAPKAGTDAKGRAGTTRHAMVISVSKAASPEITEDDVDNRNSLLNMTMEICFWCRIKKKECFDHAHPCCNTTDHEYSYTNVLNVVPSCNSCNSKKGGKRLQTWITEYLPGLGWTVDEIRTYEHWLLENDHKLRFDKETVDYLERQFIHINQIHTVLECCAKNKLEVGDFITLKEE